MQRMMLSDEARAARVFSATIWEVSWKSVRRSEWPSMYGSCQIKITGRWISRVVTTKHVPRITYGMPASTSCSGLVFRAVVSVSKEKGL